MCYTPKSIDWENGRADCEEEPEEDEPCYRDGSLMNECWAADQ